MSASLLQRSLRTLQVDALIEAFYHLDESVKGEFLGMQMSKGLRGDIQEIADRAGVPALSCRRQFENLKRISKGRREFEMRKRWSQRPRVICMNT